MHIPFTERCAESSDVSRGTTGSGRPRRARLAAVGVVTVLALAPVAACGGSSGSSGGGKTLDMWTFKQSHLAGLKAAAAAFKKQTGITVNIEVYGPDDAYTTKVQAAAKTHDLPDVLEVHSDGEDLVLGSAGISKDISSDVGSDWSGLYQSSVQQSGTVTAEKYKESLPTDSTSHGVKQGQRFSVPFTSGTFGIVMGNKKALAAAGITKAPATYEEWLQDLKATKAKDPVNGGLSLGLKVKSTGLTWAFQPLAFAELGKDDYHALFSQDPAKDLASPNGVKALNLYSELQPYWMPGTQSLDIDGADQAFAQGKSAWDIGGTFTLAFLQQNGMQPDDVLAFGIPGPAGGAVPKPALGPLALTGLAVTSTSTHQADAEKWMKFLAQPSVASQFAKAATEVSSTELGADAATVMGPTLYAMTKTFAGTPENTYDPSDNSFRPAGYDQDSMSDIIADLTPLHQKSAAQTGKDMEKLNNSFWKNAQK
ncbi:ABC transporter substrate-binding protein [Actinacidiphila yeochonensis]|uniref:ABC transporter substrate-binding protein n=1 Tax=Actinacidiphila yeochonensis TaxID=89050 RepID=UPI00099DD4A7|nr:extracellular solute-binding protein [Actinacidiphila yeochonensis]